jgi:hypothetical protein
MLSQTHAGMPDINKPTKLWERNSMLHRKPCLCASKRENAGFMTLAQHQHFVAKKNINLECNGRKQHESHYYSSLFHWTKAARTAVNNVRLSTIVHMCKGQNSIYIYICILLIDWLIDDHPLLWEYKPSILIMAHVYCALTILFRKTLLFHSGCGEPLRKLVVGNHILSSRSWLRRVRSLLILLSTAVLQSFAKDFETLSSKFF